MGFAIEHRGARGAPQVDPVWLRERLLPAARAADVELGADAAAALAGYSELLLGWNRRINLTGARTAEELSDLHLSDALALIGQLPPEPGRLVDVGSGGGLPGVVLAVLRPDLEVTLLEPIQKKCAFLSTVRRELKLRNLRELNQRLEEHLALPDREQYALAVSRATWPVAEWLERGRALVAPGGLLFALEGRERSALPAGAERLPYRLGDRTRAMVRLRV